MVDVVVADVHPADVFGLDEENTSDEELLAAVGEAGVDDDGLLAPDDERVEGDDDGGDALAFLVVDDERLGRDPGRLEPGLGGGSVFVP